MHCWLPKKCIVNNKKHFFNNWCNPSLFFNFSSCPWICPFQEDSQSEQVLRWFCFTKRNLINSSDERQCIIEKDNSLLTLMLFKSFQITGYTPYMLYILGGPTKKAYYISLLFRIQNYWSWANWTREMRFLAICRFLAQSFLRNLRIFFYFWVPLIYIYRIWYSIASLEVIYLRIRSLQRLRLNVHDAIILFGKADKYFGYWLID